jgi:uncharacterized protein
MHQKITDHASLEFKNSASTMTKVKERSISGYASVYEVTDTHNDLIVSGAFAESVQAYQQGEYKIPLLWQHQADKPIGVIKELSEDLHGLYLTAEILADIHYGKEALSLIKSEAICGLSIGFSLLKAHTNDENIRVIEQAKLWEVSLVTFPANQQACITQLKSQNFLLLRLANSLEKALKVVS